MKEQIKSIFNLIEIFRQQTKPINPVVNAATHCEKSYHHDFYCDAERPFISL